MGNHNKPWQVLPEAFRERLAEIVPIEDFEPIMESFCTRHPSTFRANTLKITAEKLVGELKKLGIEVEQVPWYTNAFVLKNVPQKTLSETTWYKEGYLYIQSLSSMIPPLVLNPKPGEKVLDLTAAPGSKTTQIAMLMENTGELVANDISRVRMYKLAANIQMQGVTIAKTLIKPGEMLWKMFPEYFDRTLVDVPCSMEGRMYTEDPKTYQDWSTKKIKELENKQRFLLRSAVSATKTGGTIVYSTCTLAPEENEGVIDWILKKEAGALEVEKIDLPNIPFTPPLMSWKGKEFNEQVQNCARILPSRHMEGFFIARLRKLRPTVV
jgi:16S rRNA (cytosine1407-C5)-methyltransferase